MNIVIVRVYDMRGFPPGISLINALLDLGHCVTVIANEVNCLPESLLNRSNLTTVDLGVRGCKINRLKHTYTDHNLIRNYLKEHKDDIDLVWTTTDISARAVGKELLGFNYVLQLSELAEYVPLFRAGPSILRDKNVVKLAKRASRVVVPEYNRAHIQKVFWDLPKTPKILPNKPYPDVIESSDTSLTRSILKRIEEDKRKKLFYQGVQGNDRCLENYAKAVNMLGKDYALYIMGKPVEASVDWYHDLSKITDQVVDLGFIPAPQHLNITPCGYIGLLPYTPKKFAHYPEINALYCAPNKIWEYSRFGLPMIGSDIPGLFYPFHEGKMGLTVDGSPESIVDAVRKIDENYEMYSKHSTEFYNTVNFKQIVSEILFEVLG